MRFLLAIVAYLIIGLLIGAGIYLGMTRGSWWFFAAAVVAYVVSFARIGCLPHKTH